MTGGPEASAVDPLTSLSGRERQVLELFAQGLANKLVASELSISEDTVKAHAKSIYHKLHVTSRLQAVLTFHDLLPLQEDGGATSETHS
jgi:ATP/maltotriose-dependent transcriptional regulator MalT